MKESKKFERKERKYAKLTETYFFNAAMHYLQRFAATQEQLRKVLKRKITRAQMRGDEVPNDALQWIENAVAKCVQFNYVDDRVFAENKKQSMRRAGKARMVIAQTLTQKGVERDMVQEVMGENDEEVELQAALRTVKRKRLGLSDDPEHRQKDLAKLLRAGFSLGVAKQALQAARNTDDMAQD